MGHPFAARAPDAGLHHHRQRLEANARELEVALQLVRKAALSPHLLVDTGRGLVDIVTRYAQTFLLQRYDEGLLAHPPEQPGGVLPTPEQARAALLLRRCWATLIKPFWRNRPIPAWKARPRTCCTS